MTNINELRRLAQAATPGPWKLLPVGDRAKRFAVADINFLSVLTVVYECGTNFGAVYLDGDAKFIAAANPAAISELLDRLEAAERERDSYKFAFSEYSEKTEWVQQGINDGTVSAKYLGWHRADVVADLLSAAEKERDALRAKVSDLAINVEYLGNLKKSYEELIGELQGERDALRARIEALERQEPVAFALYSGWARKAVYFSEIDACDQRDRRQLTADLGGSLEAYRVVPLIRAHGAKGEGK